MECVQRLMACRLEGNHLRNEQPEEHAAWRLAGAVEHDVVARSLAQCGLPKLFMGQTLLAVGTALFAHRSA